MTIIQHAKKALFGHREAARRPHTEGGLTPSERQLLIASFESGVGARTVIDDDDLQVIADKLAGTPHTITR